ncbi:unnamed protein product [Ambrosiozyma monospora]|uniref:Unnamed protein product n=1 Tax=Ambrosiozyma monospora TaxID=43982 RepID=A0A9W6TCB6_AMBMO|nr:unnamed protein product [Ambrosiozyma monospora]
MLITKSVSKTGASCIFVSSGASVNPADAWSAYGASKAALNLFCTSLNKEEGDKIKTISVAPGVVDTEMQVDIREKFGSSMKPEALKRFTDLHEKGQLLPPTVPGSIYANLALKGIPDGLSGQYIRYNNELLAQFLDQ